MGDAIKYIFRIISRVPKTKKWQMSEMISMSMALI